VAVLLAVALMPLLQWRQLSSEALRNLLRAEMSRVSDSVYVLQISPVRLRLLPGAIAFDSAYVTTDTIRKAGFPDRPRLRVSAHDCQLSGVNVWRLIRKQGLYGSLFQCKSVKIGAQVATSDSVAPKTKERRGGLGFLRMQREFRLPDMLPLINVRDVDFPDIRLDLTRQRRSLPSQSVALQQFSAHFVDVVIDPQQPISERRPLFSRQIALAAEELAIGSGAATVSFHHMAANLDKGSITLLGLRMEPNDSAAAWFKTQTYRRPWVRLQADSVQFAGINLAELIMNGTVTSDRIVIGGLNTTIETDHSLPPRPTTVQAVSPLHETAAAASTVRLEADTVELIDGTARYVQHRPGAPNTSVWLPHVAFKASEILIDPDLPPARQRPLLARVVNLNLDGATYGTADSLKLLVMGQLRLQVGDSVLVARQVSVGPGISDAAWMRRQKVRQTLGRATIDSVVLRGVNYDRLIVHSILDAREMAVSGVRVRLQKDMGLPAPPKHAERAQPALDSTLADLGVPTNIGRLSAVGDVTYIEHHPGLPDREFTVKRVAVTGDKLVVDGSGPMVPLMRQRITMVLSDIDRHWGTVRSLAVGRVTASLDDSTLTIDSIRIAPHYTRFPRRTSVKVALDSMRLTGVDFVRLADGHGAIMRQAIFGNASFDVTVDAGVRDSRLTADSRPTTHDSAFTGLSFPIEIGDLEVLKGRGLYTRLEPGKPPLVLSLARIGVTGHALALQRGVARPLLEQDIVARVSGVTLSGAPANARAESVAINLGDSTISLHGIRVRTGSARDSSRAGELPTSGVSIALDSVELAGIHLGDLVRGKAVRMNRVAVGAVDVEVRHVATPKDSLPEPTDRETGQKAGLPLAIGNLSVPVVHFRYVILKPGGEQRVYSVKNASVSAEGVALNPGASRESRIRHISKRAVVMARDIVIDDNPMNSFTIGTFAASLSDSSARIGGIRIGPTVPDSVWVSRQSHRRDRIRVGADSVLLAGLDFDRMILGDGLWLRHGRVYGFGIDAFTDKNLKPDTVKKVHSTVQHNVQNIKFPFGIDSLSVIDGAVVYNELEVGKPDPGGVTFTNISAMITGFTSRGVAGTSPPLRIETHSTLFGLGKLDAYATVPLTAPGFDAVYYGRLGPMPATAINLFAEKNLPVTIEAGQFREVTFSVGAKDGHAVGTIVPVYTGLRVKLHDPNAGFFKRVKFSVLTFVARTFFIRRDNPGNEGEPPRVGTIDHTFEGESVIQFLWFAVRGGIEKAILK